MAKFVDLRDDSHLKKGVVRSIVVRKVKENYGQENIKHFLASVLTFRKAMTWCEKS